MILFVDNLCNIDFSYLCAKRGLVGETWLASVSLSGELDYQGMICDFGIVKKKLRHWLDITLDHKLLVPSESKSLKQSTSNGQTKLEFIFGDKDKLLCTSPTEAVTFVQCTSITPDSVAIWAQNELRSFFGAGVAALSLSFKPEFCSAPYYHYSHGLKKHAGNCQRIAHGHRSRIEIWRNDRLSETDMKWWSENWCDIYLGTQDDIVEQDDHNTTFAYSAKQGDFSLTLPSSRCDFIELDTTVERIAQHIAAQLHGAYPDENIRVKAYEGINKGAIAEVFANKQAES